MFFSNNKSAFNLAHPVIRSLHTNDFITKIESNFFFQAYRFNVNKSIFIQLIRYVIEGIKAAECSVHFPKEFGAL